MEQPSQQNYAALNETDTDISEQQHNPLPPTLPHSIDIQRKLPVPSPINSSMSPPASSSDLQSQRGPRFEDSTISCLLDLQQEGVGRGGSDPTYIGTQISNNVRMNVTPEQANKFLDRYLDKIGKQKSLDDKPNILALEKKLKDFYKNTYHHIRRVLPHSPSLPTIKCFIHLAIVQKREQIKSENAYLKKLLETHERSQLYKTYEDIFDQHDKTVTLIQNIFQDRIDKNYSRIIVFGRPGIGKSTACEFGTYKWACSRADSVVFWPQFKLVFTIKARNLAHSDYKKDSSFEHIILNECFSKIETKPTLEEIRALLNAYPKKEILINIDGIDEFNWLSPCATIIKQLIERPSLEEKDAYNVVVYTRAFAKIKECEFDTIMECTGFMDDEITKYIQLDEVWVCTKDGTKLNSVETKARQQKILNFLQDNLAIHALMHVPLLLDMFCAICTEEILQCKDLTITELYDIFMNHFWAAYDKRLELVSPHRASSRFKDKARLFLRLLAFKAMQNNYNLMSQEFVEGTVQYVYKCEKNDVDKHLEDILDVGLLYSPDKINFYFPHLTIQEYLSAQYLCEIYYNRIPFDISIFENKYMSVDKFVAYNKHLKRYEYMLIFLSGLLDKDIILINRYFKSILGNPKDIIGHYNRLLFMRCINECNLKQVSGYLKKVSKYILHVFTIVNRSGFESRGLIDIIFSYLRLCSHLLQLKEIKDAILNGMNKSGWDIKMRALTLMRNNMPLLNNDDFMREQVANMLFDHDGDVRLDAKYYLAMSHIEMPIVNKIVKRLHCKQPQIQMINIVYLAELHTPTREVEEELKRTLQSDDMTVKSLSALTLGILGIDAEQVFDILKAIIESGKTKISISELELNVEDALLKLVTLAPEKYLPLLKIFILNEESTSLFGLWYNILNSPERTVFLKFLLDNQGGLEKFFKLATVSANAFSYVISEEALFLQFFSKPNRQFKEKWLKKYEARLLVTINKILPHVTDSLKESILKILIIIERYDIIPLDLVLRKIIVGQELSVFKAPVKKNLKSLVKLLSNITLRIYQQSDLHLLDHWIHLLGNICDLIRPIDMRSIIAEFLLFVNYNIESLSIFVLSLLVSIIDEKYINMSLKDECLIYYRNAKYPLKYILANILYLLNDKNSEVEKLVIENINNSHGLIRITAAIVLFIKRKNISSAFPLLSIGWKDKTLPAHIRFKIINLLKEDDSFIDSIISQIDFSLAEYNFEEFESLLSKKSENTIVLYLSKKFQSLPSETHNIFLYNFMLRIKNENMALTLSLVNQLFENKRFVKALGYALNKLRLSKLTLSAKTLAKLDTIEGIPFECLTNELKVEKPEDLKPVVLKLQAQLDYIIFFDEATQQYHVIASDEHFILTNALLVKMLMLNKYILLLQNSDEVHSRDYILKILDLNKSLKQNIIEIIIFLQNAPDLDLLSAATQLSGDSYPADSASPRLLASTGFKIGKDVKPPLYDMSFFEYILNSGSITYEDYIIHCYVTLSDLYKKNAYAQILNIATNVDFDWLINFYKLDRNLAREIQLGRISIFIIVSVALIKMHDYVTAQALLFQLLARLLLPVKDSGFKDFILPIVNWYLICLQRSHKYQLSLETGQIFENYFQQNQEIINPITVILANDRNTIVYFLLLFHASLNLHDHGKATQYLFAALDFDILNGMCRFRLQDREEIPALSIILSLSECNINNSLEFYKQYLEYVLSSERTIDQIILYGLFVQLGNIYSLFGQKKLALWSFEIARRCLDTVEPEKKDLKKFDERVLVYKYEEPYAQLFFSFFSEENKQIKSIDVNSLPTNVDCTLEDKQQFAYISNLLSDRRDKTQLDIKNEISDPSIVELVKVFVSTLTENLDYSEEIKTFIISTELKIFEQKYSYICNTLYIFVLKLSYLETEYTADIKQGCSLYDKHVEYLLSEINSHVKSRDVNHALLQQFCNEFLLEHRLPTEKIIYILNQNVKMKFELPLNFKASLSKYNLSSRSNPNVAMFRLTNANCIVVNCHKTNNGLFAFALAVKIKSKLVTNNQSIKNIPQYVHKIPEALLRWRNSDNSKTSLLLRNALYRSLLENHVFIKSQRHALRALYQIKWATKNNMMISLEEVSLTLSHLLQKIANAKEATLFNNISSIYDCRLEIIQELYKYLILNKEIMMSFYGKIKSIPTISQKVSFINQMIFHLIDQNLKLKLLNLFQQKPSELIIIHLIEHHLALNHNAILDDHYVDIRYQVGCLLIEHFFEESWELIYADYAKQCLELTTEPSATELSCLAAYWSIGLKINKRTYLYYDTNSILIDLNQLSSGTWQVNLSESMPHEIAAVQLSQDSGLSMRYSQTSQNTEEPLYLMSQFFTA